MYILQLPMAMHYINNKHINERASKLFQVAVHSSISSVGGAPSMGIVRSGRV